MRIIAPHGAFPRRLHVDDAPLSPRARKRLDVITSVAALVAAGCPKDAAIASQGVKRRTYHRRRLRPLTGRPCVVSAQTRPRLKESLKRVARRTVQGLFPAIAWLRRLRQPDA